MKIAGLTDVLTDRLKASAATAAASAPSTAPGAAGTPTGAAPGPAFATYWGIVFSWDVSSRYGTKNEADARELLTAITDPHDGILTWLRNYW